MSRDFWSRRRAAVAAEQEAEAVRAEAAEVAQTEAELEARPDAEILAERNLPDPDTLETPEDVRAFLSETLPQRLKTRALRRLWRLNPVLANLDGLVDYGEDFTDKAMVIENLQTAYQVGKGMLKHIEALAEAEAAKTAEPEHTPEMDDADTEELLAQDLPDETYEVVIDPAPQREPVYADSDDLPEADYALRPRRMTFTFEDQRT